MVLWKPDLMLAELVSNAVWLVMVMRTTSFCSFSTRAWPDLISAREVLLQVALLVVHVAADRAAGERAADCADHGALGAVLVVGDRADHRAADRADQRAVLAVAHVADRLVGGAAGEREAAMRMVRMCVSWSGFSCLRARAPSLPDRCG